MAKHPRMTVYDNIIQAIGKTPLVKLNHVTDNISATIYAKLEYINIEFYYQGQREL